MSFLSKLLDQRTKIESSVKKEDQSYSKKALFGSIIRRNNLVTFPEILCNDQKLYRQYDNIPIIDIEVSDYDSLSLCEPLFFYQTPTNKVGVYQKGFLIGYLQSGKGEKMTLDFLSRNDIVVALLSCIDNQNKELRMSVAYYRNYKKNNKHDLSQEEIAEEVKRSVNCKLSDLGEESDKTIVLPLIMDGKELFSVFSNYNLYIVNKNQTKSALKNISSGVPVEILKEPNNKYDSNAVMIQYNNTTIGYIYNECKDLANILTDTNDVKGYITSLDINSNDIEVRIALFFYF